MGHTHNRFGQTRVSFVIHQNGQQGLWVFLRRSHDGQCTAHEHLHRWIGLIHLAASLVSVWFPWRCDEHREQRILSVKNHETTSPDTSHCNTTRSVLSDCTIRAVWECWIGLERERERDSESSCFYTEIVRRKRERRRSGRLFMASVPPPPPLPSSVLQQQDISDLFCLLPVSGFPLLPSEHRIKGHQVLIRPNVCAPRCTLCRLSFVIMYAAATELLMTSDGLSQWHCHCCESADSKMADIQVMLEVKCCTMSLCLTVQCMCMPTLRFCHPACRDELFSRIACSKIPKCLCFLYSSRVTK